MRHFISTPQLRQMDEPYTFGISEIEAKTKFGNSIFLGEILPSIGNVWKFFSFLSKISN